MTYRDDLEAAHARITSLENQLAEAGGEVGGLAALLSRCDDLAAQIARMRSQVDELAATHARLVESLRSPSGDLPTVTEYNRGSPPGETALSGRPAGVRCSMCLLLYGESVEMRVGGRLLMVCKQDNQVGGVENTVRCPRCDDLKMLIG